MDGDRSFSGLRVILNRKELFQILSDGIAKDLITPEDLASLVLDDLEWFLNELPEEIRDELVNEISFLAKYDEPKRIYDEITSNPKYFMSHISNKEYGFMLRILNGHRKDLADAKLPEKGLRTIRTGGDDDGGSD